MLLGFAVTRHCNLRCAHCIRDDVTLVQSIDPALLDSITAQALDLFGDIRVSLTGGEPLIHPRFDEIVESFRTRGVPWRLTTNGWHLRRALPTIDRYPPTTLRLSLSGGSRETHDAERGRGSWRRVLESIALSTSRRIPVWLSLVVDRRDRHELRTAVEFAEAMGVNGISFILPQPVPGSAARGSDLPPGEWPAVRDEVFALAAGSSRTTAVKLDYGYPTEGPQPVCDTFALKQIYVDPEGRLCSCCQLSEYGANEAEVVADLKTMRLGEAWKLYRDQLRVQRQAAAAPEIMRSTLGDFPCLRCAKACGKLEWLAGFPGSPWCGAGQTIVDGIESDASFATTRAAAV